ncbi:MAG: hypothetical protein RJA70_1207 [Pseudomonadota bacterium]|jgi:PAS domain S-box-containing protein
MSCAHSLAPILEAVSEAVVLVDPSLVVGVANTGAQNWFGRNPTGESLKSLLPPDQHAALTELIQRAKIGGQPHSATLNVMSQCGHRSARLRVTKGQTQDQIFYTLCFALPCASPAEDPHEIKDRYRTLLDAAFEGIFIHEGGLILEANAAACEMTGYSRDELLGMRVALLSAPHAGAEPTEQGRALAAGEDDEFGPIEFVGVARDGSTAEIELLNKPVVYEGRHVRMSAFRDITAHKANERALKRRVEFDDLMTSISADFINLKTSEIDAGLSDALRRIAEFAGADRSYVFRFQDGERQTTHQWLRAGAPPVKPELESTRKADDSWSMQHFKQFRPVCVFDRSALPPAARNMQLELEHQGVVSCVAIPMVFEKRIIGIVGFDTLTEQRSWSDETVQLLQTAAYVFASALERKQTQEGLERTVQERTRQLRNKQLQLARSEKLAALGQLVAGVAHEINTPLGAIKSNNDTLVRATQRLKEQLFSPCGSSNPVAPKDRVDSLLAIAQKVIAVNTEAIERIVSIVGGLRKFARLDEAEVDTVDLHDGIETTLTVANHLLRNRIKVEKHFGPLPQVQCYPNQLNQVFMNLLVNSTQAIQGEGTITITTRQVGEQVEILFQDTGCGISRDAQDRIFDPGFTTKGVGVGTGLGLSIVHQIVDDHGGEIEVSSELGRGSTFLLRLPLTLPVRAPSSLPASQRAEAV